MSEWFTKDINFSKYAQAVVDWNGVAYGTGHNKPLDAQWALVEEEGLVEVPEAYTAKDKAEFLKEMIDLFVVASYYHHLKHGNIDFSFFWMSYSRELSLAPLCELMDGLTREIRDCNIEDTLAFTFAILSKLDADVEGAIEEVLRSNDSKFVGYSNLDEVAYDSECKRLEEGGRYKGVHWKAISGKVVFKSGEGKILKPLCSYSPADVSKFIKEEK